MVNPVIPVFQGGQMTDLPPLALEVFDGTELFEIVAPGNPALALNYRITSTQLSLLLANLISGSPVIVTDGATTGVPYVVPSTVSRVLFDKTVGAPSGALLGPAQAQLLPVLIRDLKGDCDVNPITVTFSAGELCDGLAQVVISTPYGGYWFNPLPSGGWYLGTA